jgi:hypothetical protein
MALPLPAIQAVTPWALPCGHGPDVRWHWDCPTCGVHTVAVAKEAATPPQIAGDARCWYCRRTRP